MGDDNREQALRPPQTQSGNAGRTGGSDVWPRAEASRDAAGVGTGSADDTGGLTSAEPKGGQGGDPAERSGSGDGLGGPDAGSPGGMGGVRVAGGTGTDRPPGGLSPVQGDRDEG
jgi:hypothetical protein